MSRDKARNLCGCDLCGFNPCLFFQSFRFLLTFGESSQFGEAQSITEIINKLSCMILYAAARIWKALHGISKSPFLRPRTSCHRDSLGTEDWKVGHPSFKKNLFRSKLCRIDTHPKKNWKLSHVPKKEKDTSSSKPSISWFSGSALCFHQEVPTSLHFMRFWPIHGGGTSTTQMAGPFVAQVWANVSTLSRTESRH